MYLRRYCGWSNRQGHGRGWEEDREGQGGVEVAGKRRPWRWHRRRHPRSRRRNWTPNPFLKRQTSDTATLISLQRD